MSRTRFQQELAAVKDKILAMAALAQESVSSSLEAYLIRDKSHVIAGRSTPSAWTVGVVALALGFPWYWLMELQFSPQSKHPPFWIPMTVCVAWAGLAYLLYRRWTSSPQWSDLHRWTLSFAATLVCMLAGFLGSSSWSRVDLVGKSLLNVVAMVAFLWLLRRMRQFAGS